MSLRFKIISGFLILTIMLFVAGLVSIHELHQVSYSVHTLLDENYKSINAAKNMIEALERQDSGILLLMSGDWETGRATLREADVDFLRAFEVAKNNITIEGEHDHILAINSAYAIYKKLWERPIVDTERQGNLDWYYNEVHPAFFQAKLTVKQLMTINDNTMYRTATTLHNRAGRAIMPGLVAIIAALIFMTIFNFFIHFYVIKPLRGLIEEINVYIDHGEESFLRFDGHDEISRLAEAIKNLIVHIKKTSAKS